MWRAEVEEFAHLTLGLPVLIAGSEGRNIKCLLDERQDRGAIARSVGDEVWLGVRRDHDQREAEASYTEVTPDLSYRAITGRAIISIWATSRSNLIWSRDDDRRHMIVEASAFVVGEDEDGIVPGIALHESGDD